MIRPFPIALVCAALLVCQSLAQAPARPDDPEPPVRLKKKNRPTAPGEKAPETKVPEAKAPGGSDEPEKKPEPPKEPKEKGDKKDEDPGNEPSAPDEQETLGRVARNMRSAENRLANKELGEGTQDVQRDILKDLDSLIEQSQRSSDQQSGEAQQQQQNGEQKNQAQRGQKAGQRKQQAKGRSRRRDQQSAQGNQPRPGNQPDNGAQPGPGGNDAKGGTGKTTGKEADRLADLYKDIWGHLPETMRAEMNAYASREEFMSKYKDQLKQYYSTIAEKGRKKGD